MNFDRNDYGIIFKGSTLVGDTYIDVWGQTRNSVLLADGFEQFMDSAIESAVAHVGSASRFSLEVTVNLQGISTVSMALHGELSDVVVNSNSPTLQTMRNSDANEDSSQTFSAAGRYVLQTENLSGVVNAAIGVTYSGTGVEGTDITVGMRVY